MHFGNKEDLTIEHILPKNRGGPDISDNAIMVCKSCNSSKRDKRLYELKGLENKDTHHRIAEGKYLKLLYKLHEERGTLDVDNVKILCPNCDMEKLCKEAGKEGKLTVYCIEGCFKKKSESIK